MFKQIAIVSALLLFVFNLSCKQALDSNQDINSLHRDTVAMAGVPIFHPSHEPAKQQAPFSDAVQVGNTYYLAGQIGMNQKTRTLVPGGIEAETEQTLENIKAVLAHHNLAMTDVVKAMVVLDDIEDFQAFNAIYTQYFPQKPARTTYAAQALAAGAKIEIEVIAVRSE